MPGQSVLDATQFVAEAAAAVVIAVQLVKMALGFESPRAKVATAILVSLALTLLWAVGAGLLSWPNAFALVIAAFTVAAAGAGVHSAATAATKP